MSFKLPPRSHPPVPIRRGVTIDAYPSSHAASPPHQVAEDESKHFSLLTTRLEELGSYYGAHTVHAGLWESALDTQDDLLARLAIIHLVHEARGLDVSAGERRYGMWGY
jgi:hypothetical protein